ncbi:hypothetical protein Acr_03g0017040 [Actinidia rufa]|uniref:3-dehydroquinate synthase n=1 Tax=Actinidia rufa TaxID=165716 RepID=A0A7J0EEY4_9ERIC|nr:hypothetical protein Acr_03g0017040 [Actinidia rufa]
MEKKVVWIWTENKQVMTAAVERGWNTLVFSSHCRDLAHEWSSMALIYPLFIEEGELFDSERRRVATFFEISCPEQLEQLQPKDEQAENVIVNLLDWQALELGLSGVVLKVEDVKAVLELKDYFDRRNETSNLLDLTKATVTQVQMAGMGDRVCVDLCSLMKPGEGLLGPVHAYVAVPEGKTCYLSELKAGKEVIVVDQSGRQRTAIVGRVKIETRPLILVEAKSDSDNHIAYSILLQNAETVALVCFQGGKGHRITAIPVTSLKVGDEVLLRIQGGARHTGIEIQEFIVENEARLKKI